MESDIDDLQYEYPVNFLNYEPRYFLGLSVIDMMMIALPAMAVIMAVNDLVLGIIAALITFLAIRRYESFGNRSLPVYWFALVKHMLTRRDVVIPSILPAGKVEMLITTLDGEVVMSYETDDTETN